ncbi:hypothetical protein AK812_SmicGene40026 [Symbiodinium microadriaticum]|uniref:Uncharacterized protein n=1 Tax=Symbiodinium microadriaticum TaxID=2951 RepID=A0A1Q9C9P6_SYMMI|nr:hypothetical protein AK812_SmicGene40026 [Symbiodinium microadriaticum]
MQRLTSSAVEGKLLQDSPSDGIGGTVEKRLLLKVTLFPQPFRLLHDTLHPSVCTNAPKGNTYSFQATKFFRAAMIIVSIRRDTRAHLAWLISSDGIGLEADLVVTGIHPSGEYWLEAVVEDANPRVPLEERPSPSASISSPGRTASRSTGPPEKDAPAEVRYMRAAQLLQDAFNGPAEREPEPQPGNEADHSPAKMRTMQMSWSSLPLEQTTTPRSMAPAPAPRPVVPARFVSACSRTLSTSAFASSSPGQEHREIHVPPASARLRWSFSDAHVAHNPQVITAPTPWRAVTSVPLASNPRSVSPTRLVASTPGSKVLQSRTSTSRTASNRWEHEKQQTSWHFSLCMLKGRLVPS